MPCTKLFTYDASHFQDNVLLIPKCSGLLWFIADSGVVNFSINSQETITISAGQSVLLQPLPELSDTTIRTSGSGTLKIITLV